MRLSQAVLAGSVVAALAALPAAAAEAAPSKSLSVRVATGSQAQAVRAKALRVRVVSSRATRVRISAGRIARPRTVRLTARKARTVSLRLTPRGRRLLAGCSSRRVTVVAVDLRRPRSRARRSRALRPGPGGCRSVATPPGKALARCGAPETTGGDWPFYSGTLDGHREQLAESTIHTGNVDLLGVAWSTATPDGGTIHSTPTVADGCVFTGTDLGNVYALNADTGKVVWEQSLGEGTEGSNTFEGAGIVGSPAIADGLVYVGATTPKASVLSALDAATGEVVWKRVVDEDEGGGLDSSPVPFDGMVFQAFKGDESSNHSNPGFVIVDGSRDGGGRILVKTHTIPAEDFEAGYRGGSIINTPAVDLARKLVFAGTGNPVSEKQHPRTNALLKIDANPGSSSFGSILASHRGTSDSYPVPQDVETPWCQTELQWPLGRFSCAQFDFNFLASPNLWTNSDGRQMFGGLQKSGVYTAVYTDTMELAWQATLGIPCFGCNLSSTAVDENGIYVAVTGGNLYSLDRDTGAVQWATPLSGSFHYNGVAVANGVLYSLNDATGTLEAFDTYTGVPLFAHPFMQDTQTPMHDMGNSSGVSVARNTVFATSQSDGTSTLFALKLGATGDPDGGDDEPPPPEEPPSGGGDDSGSSEAVIATGPGAASYGYLTPIVTIGKGGKASYVNVDAARHNVSSPEGLFRSELAGTGERVPVAGVENLEPGTYSFICEPHPNMKGQLVVR
ncbi:MAG TPA: PQQ-binding-like beta-propeller repeat protein [Solirubrobacteraceae bacterium]|jgi:polyvinyl alcohol dehydrogenase (cytochrome)